MIRRQTCCRAGRAVAHPGVAHNARLPVGWEDDWWVRPVMSGERSLEPLHHQAAEASATAHRLIFQLSSGGSCWCTAQHRPRSGRDSSKSVVRIATRSRSPALYRVAKRWETMRPFPLHKVVTLHRKHRRNALVALNQPCMHAACNKDGQRRH